MLYANISFSAIDELLRSFVYQIKYISISFEIIKKKKNYIIHVGFFYQNKTTVITVYITFTLLKQHTLIIS